MSHHYNTNSSGKQGLFWEGNPGYPVRHHQDPRQNKTAVNKGVWEFRELRQCPGTSCISSGRSSVDLPGACGVLTPQIVKAIP